MLLTVGANWWGHMFVIGLMTSLWPGNSTNCSSEKAASLTARLNGGASSRKWRSLSSVPPATSRTC
ncbi:hypothetical protein PF005_g24291 [Phytophthora fragariae]|uniref:Uncharacterized protein n=1 Tax=Phytophthora fragariae TaxID=53985 RepID=A0A6A3IJK3_9STRA|nr:hypothetical protein PF003_g13811 [Phytophthora fragariae]KAE8927049.1 hypothetical protein PF009_g22776 [Phytophthora fragariae]KAE8979913.1 hypothetical protein PF011_g22655 [Phytophthora fragariae]KAE9077313.1 hypothetical protein PF007_g24291 [Phytophthora fragariae]KAE9083416.1 hypothetical protein PF010_g21223 [Phytophthora fragariae]